MRTIRRTIVIAALAAALAPALAHAAVVRHYSFDTNYNDFSGNNQHGAPVDGNANASTAGVAITNTAGQWVFGGGAASFNDERDWVGVPSLTFASGSPYSISFWARDATAPVSTNIGGMVIGQTGNTNLFIWIDSGPGGLRWRSIDSSAARQADFALTLDNLWHHYVVIAGDFEDADATVDEIRLYRDNVLIGTDDGNLTGFVITAIGDAYNGSLNVDYQGQIDEVWVFNHALNADEVGKLYAFNDIAAPAPAALPAGMAMLIALTVRRRRRRR